MVGAILTQNTAWSNVEKAISALRSRGLLSPEALSRVKDGELAVLIRPAGYFRQKARKLKNLCSFLENECSGEIKLLSGIDTDILRGKLLSVNGIGPETADSILLYALCRPVFVVDAYTKRIFKRHLLIDKEPPYDELRNLVHDNFPRTVEQLNAFHAYIVETGKRYCRKKSPLCRECPLGRMKRNVQCLAYGV
ncbi:MAG: endonuclease III domain-containing protein [Candidatus Omnitrophica bacterium]|nr:endonuclease III domain-containing protein [Candidatus Omnitrophota bacterium]